MDPTNQHHEEPWSACPPGMLRRMADEVREHRRRDGLRRVTSILAVACVVASGAFLGGQAYTRWAAPNGPQEIVTLRCSEIRKLLVEYGHGALADSVREQISAHLRECPHCREQHLKLQKEEQEKKQTSWLAKKAPAKT
jgi:hypothetical protein